MGLECINSLLIIDESSPPVVNMVAPAPREIRDWIYEDEGRGAGVTVSPLEDVNFSLFSAPVLEDANEIESPLLVVVPISNLFPFVWRDEFPSNKESKDCFEADFNPLPTGFPPFCCTFTGIIWLLLTWEKLVMVMASLAVVVLGGGDRRLSAVRLACWKCRSMWPLSLSWRAKARWQAGIGQT